MGGAPGGTAIPGAAGIYSPTANTPLWTLTSPSASHGDLFGTSVAVAGNYLVVGAPGDDTSGKDTGRAFVFNAVTGALVSTLINPAPDPNAQSVYGTPEGFGDAVAILGSTVFVGADHDPDPAGFTGNVYRFDAATGTYLGKLTPPPAASAPRFFGTALSASGNRLAVSALLGGSTLSGQVYVYDASDPAVPQVTVDEPGLAPGTQDRFGQSVALVGNTLVAGAPLRDLGGNNDVGVAYVFDLPAGAGTATLRWTLNNPHPDNSGEWFGQGVGLSNNAVIVGSPYDDTNSQFNGQAYVFNATTGASLGRATNPVTSGFASFGWAVAAAGDKLVGGAYGLGRVYTFQGLSGPAPVAQDDSFGLAEDSPATDFNVLANDTPTTPGLVVATVSQPAHGTASIAGGGTTVIYTPAADYNGPDSFTYTAQDPNGTSGSATVAITVTSVNDPPAAADDLANLTQDGGARAIDVLANDSTAPDAGETLTITGVTQGAHGTVMITGGGTELTYAPAAGYAGADIFRYTVSDGNGGSATGVVSVAVLPPAVGGNVPPTAVVDAAAMVEDAGPLPIGVLANDSAAPDAGETLTVTAVTPPAHGTATVAADGLSVTYTPGPDFAGTDTFYYTVSDGHGELASAPVIVTVANDAADRLEVVPSAGALDFTEGDGSKPLDAGVRVGTAAGGLVTKAVVKFASGYVKRRDTLTFTAPTGVKIKGTYAAGTGTLTLTGKASPDDYEKALQAVAYRNVSDDPVGGPRTVSITLYDATGAGSPGYREVHVTAVNDAPTATLPATALAVKAARPALVLSGLKLADPDSAFLTSATVTIGNAQAGDALNVALGKTGLTVTNTGGTLTISGTASRATYLKVLKSITLTAGAAGPLRTLSVTVNDGDLDSAPATRPVTVG